MDPTTNVSAIEVATLFRGAATLRHRGNGRYVLWAVSGVEAPLVFPDRRAALTFKERVVPVKEFSKWNVKDCSEVNVLRQMTRPFEGKVIIQWAGSIDGHVYGLLDMDNVEVALSLPSKYEREER